MYQSFEAAFAHVFDVARQERTVFVIDEYPYLAASYPGVSSLLQALIDQRRATSKLMVILCGSSMSFMEHQVLGEKSPLYGRRTAQLRLEPFDYLDAAQLLGSADPVRLLEMYGLVGGIPLYLEQLDASHSTEWNMAHKVFGVGRFLYAEPQNLLMQEISSPASYISVIDALAHGRTRPSEIADATGIQAPNVNEYLKKLIELGVVRKDEPVGYKSKRRVVYRIADNLFRFWHSYVPKYGQAVELGLGQDVAHRIAREDFSAYMGHVFEDVCRQWLMRQIASGEIDLLPTRIGTWWGTDPAAHEQADIDVVALGADGEVVCGECKWTAEPVGADVIDTLAHRAALVGGASSKTQLLVFSKAGYAESAEREARRRGDVRLVGVAEMFENG